VARRGGGLGAGRGVNNGSSIRNVGALAAKANAQPACPATRGLLACPGGLPTRHQLPAAPPLPVCRCACCPRRHRGGGGGQQGAARPPDKAQPAPMLAGGWLLPGSRGLRSPSRLRGCARLPATRCVARAQRPPAAVCLLARWGVACSCSPRHHHPGSPVAGACSPTAAPPGGGGGSPAATFEFWWFIHQTTAPGAAAAAADGAPGIAGTTGPLSAATAVFRRECAWRSCPKPREAANIPCGLPFPARTVLIPLFLAASLPHAVPCPHCRHVGPSLTRVPASRPPSPQAAQTVAGRRQLPCWGAHHGGDDR
jgi:hypothetical protein